MSKGVSAVEYIMEDPREAMRLEVKVDAHAWVQKYLAHRVICESLGLLDPSRRVQRHRRLYDERTPQRMPLRRQLQRPLAEVRARSRFGRR